MMERNGQRLGEYRLIQRLGGDEVAEVYLSEHVFLKTLAALKILQVSLFEQDKPASLREVRTIAGLIHPNIVRLLDFGVQDELFFLVMEYVPGGDTLWQIYPPGSRLSPIAMLLLLKPIANALQYAHDQDVIHGTVKPEHILVGIGNEVLLSGFGMASIYSQPLLSGPYSAPEQLDGKSQPASDQYALAVIAYELLNSDGPFRVKNIATSGTTPTIPLEVTEVLDKALEQEPVRRFSTIRAFIMALEQACGEMPEEVVSPISIPLSPPPVPSLVYQSQEATMVGESKAYKDVEMLPAFVSLQPIAGAFTAEPQRVPDTKRRDTSRRVFLTGIGSGVIVIGGVVFLAASGKIAYLFAGTAPKSTQVPVVSTRPPATLPPTEQPTQELPTSTPGVPIGTTLTTYTGQSSDVTGVCWSPIVSNGMVASCSQDGTAAIWNATTTQPARIFPKSGPRTTLAWSPDGKYIALADGTNIGVWDGADGANLISTCTGHTQLVLGLAWSPDGLRLVSTSQDHTAIVWDAATGNQHSTFKGHSEYVWVVAWAPNGSSIATGSWDNTVQIWNPDTGVLVLRYTATKPVRAVDWSPDSSLIASGGDDNSVQVWQATTGNVQVTYSGHSDHIETVQWSRDGQSIASASKDTTVQIWQASTANLIYTYTGHSQLVWSLAWSPDGHLIISGSQDATAKVWQAT